MVKVNKFLRVNRKIEIRLDVEGGKYYKSLVQGVKGNLFLINPPYRGRDDLFLHRGDRVEVILLTNKEKYVFASSVVDRVTTPLQGYVLEAPEEAKRIQLREFVRIQIAQDVEWAELVDGTVGKLKLEEMSFTKSIMVDLSGGGARFVADDPIAEGTRLLLRFDIITKDVERPMAIVSEVRRSQRIDERKKYAISVAFLGLSDREQDQIVQYVFLKQREQRFLERGE